MPENGPMTILVVDDSATARKMIRQELTDGGYVVIEAEDGFSALAKAVASPRPDLITLDVEMPKLDGFATCRKLREERYARFFADQKNKMVPVIFVTSVDTLEARSLGFQLGAIDFINKPFAKGAILAAVNKILRPENLLKGLTALVVDDSQLVRNLVSKTLEQQGVKVLEAVNGREAFATAQNFYSEIDLVVTDFNMPEMNGDELCHLLRRDLKMDQVPIIFLTARTEKEIILDIFRAGATDYIIKPFVQEEVLARIKVHLEVRRLLKELSAEVKIRKEAEQELRKLNQSLKEMSIRDGLTGLFNHRHFQEQLHNAFLLARRHAGELTVAMLDLDHFKLVNDNFGHPFGDFVLKGFADIMKKLVRETDIVARYGGEEFVILLPQTDLKGGVIFAERLRKKAESHVYNDGLHAKQVTISIGLASFKDNKTRESGELLSFADQALYQAKAGGRNCVVASTSNNLQENQ